MRSLTQTEMKSVTGGLRAAGGGGMHPDLYPAPGGGDGGVPNGWVVHDGRYTWGVSPNGTLFFETPYLSALQGNLYGAYNISSGDWQITDQMTNGTTLSFEGHSGTQEFDLTHAFDIGGVPVYIGGGVTYDGSNGYGIEGHVAVHF